MVTLLQAKYAGMWAGSMAGMRRYLTCPTPLLHHYGSGIIWFRHHYGSALLTFHSQAAHMIRGHSSFLDSRGPHHKCVAADAPHGTQAMPAAGRPFNTPWTLTHAI